MIKITWTDTKIENGGATADGKLTAAEWNAHVTDQEGKVYSDGDTMTDTLIIDQNSNATGLVIDSEATTGVNYALSVVADQGCTVVNIQADTNDFYRKGAPTAGVGSNWFYRNLTSGTTAGSVMFIEQDNASDDQNALTIQNDGTGFSLDIDQTGDETAVRIASDATTAAEYALEVSTGLGANAAYFRTTTSNYVSLARDPNSYPAGTNLFYRNLASADTSGCLVRIEQDNSGDDQEALIIQNDGSGYGLFIDQNGDGRGLYVSSSATTAGSYGLQVDTGAGGADIAYFSATGSQFVRFGAEGSSVGDYWFYRNLTNSSTASPVMFIEQDNTGDDQDVLKIQQDGTGNTVLIDHNSTINPALNIDIVDGDAHIRLVGDSGNATPTEGDFWRESDGLKYYDGTTEYNLLSSGGSPEGTAVLSTGETGGTKYLREDGDGTCSWQTPSGSGDVSKVGTPVNNQVGVWTGDGTIEGDTDLTFDGSNLAVGGNITVGGTVDGIDIATDVAANTTKVSCTTTNVTTAGALMDSEVDADIKTLSLPASTTISTFGASLVDDADAATARATLGAGTGDLDNVVEDTTPQLGGNLDWNSNGNMLVGQTVGGSDGDLVYLSSANTWTQADADAEATASGMFGIRISSTTVLTNGVYTTSGLTAANTYYASATAGGITTTAPSTTGQIVRIIGYAISTTEFFFDPDKTYVEVA